MLLPDKVGSAVDDSDIMLAKGASGNVCVKILDLQPSDIYPMTNIPLSISPSNTSAGIVCMHNGLILVLLYRAQLVESMIIVPN